MAIKIAGTEVINDNKRVLNNESLPDVRPSLLLDFANSKTLDPRITFTRGSTATYWDGKTTAKAEENLLRYSQVLEGVNSGGNWSTQSATVTDNDATAPDGTTTAAKLQGDGTSSEHRLFTANNNNTPVTNSTGQFAFSIFAKAGTNNYIQIRTNQSDNGYANFDISSGTAHPTTASASITDVGSGWYRCEIIFADSVTTPANISVHLVTSTSASRPEINTLSTYVHLWGAQLEDRTSVTAYTATTSSPIVKYQPVLQTAASGEARFDHDPVTGESKGLLIEEARTNLIEVSEAISTGWGTANAGDALNPIVTDDAIVSPDGNITGTEIYTTGTYQGVYKVKTVSTGSTYTASVYVKGSISDLRLRSRIDGGTLLQDVQSTINLSTGSVTSGNAGIEYVGNGWYRVYETVTVANSNTSWGVYVSNQTSGANQTYFVWGAQLEAGSFPTSYIPTSGSTVTRVGEFAAMSSSEIGYYGGDFTVYSASTLARDNTIGGPTPVLIGSRLASSITPQGGNYHYQYYRANGASGSTIYLDNTIYADTNPTGTITANQELRIATAYSKDDFATSGNGGTVLTDASVPDFYGINSIHFGNGAQLLNGHLSKVAFWNERLPNATLQAMTEA